MSPSPESRLLPVRAGTALAVACALLGPAAALTTPPLGAVAVTGPGQSAANALAASPRIAPAGAAPAAPAGAIDPAVASAIEPANRGTAPIPVIVYLASPNDRVAGRRLPAEPSTNGSPAAGPWERLQSEARVRSGGVLAAIRQAEPAGRAGEPRLLWLADAVAVQADPELIRELAARPDVAYIGADPIARTGPWAPERTDPARAGDGVDAEPLPYGPDMLGAREVWERLGVDGTGVTVAALDSGVDYFHPALRGAYRGEVGADLPSNAGNWWCKAVDPLCGLRPLYPVDGVGHGTHVVGIIVGAGGIGMAPGARWIGARVCLEADYCQSSWIVEALQWLVDRPAAQLPRILNMSLSLEDTVAIGRATEQVLDAGIVVVAASGNDRQRIRAPAVYPGVIAVGAVDSDGELWGDSGYGRSLEGEVKPDVVAPGVAVVSSVPGGGRALNTGTSMAAPHVAGTLALLLSQKPDLTPAEAAEVLRRTARPIHGSTTLPSPTSGWGLVNAYGALLTVADVGHVSGEVIDALDETPIPWARVRIATETGDPVTSTSVEADGSYRLDLRPGTYLVIAEAFAYAEAQPVTVDVREDATATVEFRLRLQEDVGFLTGTLADAETGAPLDGRISLAGVPEQFDIVVDRIEGFGRRLPPGWYELSVSRFGHRVLRDSIKVTAGSTIVRDYRLNRSPRLLLVDGDGWAYSQAREYFRASLDRLGYTYHVHVVADEAVAPGLAGGPPALEKLQQYDIVIWSSSVTGPTFVRGAGPLSAYLAAGGRLLLSGQDALCTDSGSAVASDPCNSKARPDPYVRDHLNVRVLADNSHSMRIAGAEDGPFAGLDLFLNGPDSMDNQSMPDVMTVLDPSAGALIATYADGRGAAALARGCRPSRALVLGFGFEGVRGAATRDDLLDRAILALGAERPEHAVVVRADVDRLLVPAGGTASFTATVTNTGSQPDEVDLIVAGTSWPAMLLRPGSDQPLEQPLALAACQSARFVVRLAVPEGTLRGTSSEVLIRAVGRAGSAHEARVTVRAPAAVLVVDGDYGRDTESSYVDALSANGTAYDLWTIGRDNATVNLPQPEDLAGYPALVWFTGDDWRQNGSLNLQTQRALADYLDGGGRLLFSSEDYLSIRGGTPYRAEALFHQDYLGVGDYLVNEGAAHSGIVAGAAGSALAGLGQCALSPKPPGQDFSDRLTAGGTGGGAAILNVFGHPVATQAEDRSFRSLFLAFDAGYLTAGCAERLMGAALDWFSPLSESVLATVPSDRQVYASGDRVRLRLELVNTGPRSLDAVGVRWSVPEGGDLDESTLPARWTWLPEARALEWSGDLARGQALTPAPQIELALPEDLGPYASMSSQAAIVGDGITITRRASWKVNSPDLGESTKSVPDNERVLAPGELASFVIHVRNTGTFPTASFLLTDTLPAGLELQPASVLVSGGSQPDLDSLPGSILWSGEVEPGRVTTLSYRARVRTTTGGWLANRAVLDDGAGTRWDLSAAVFATPRLFLPWLAAQVETDP